MHAMSRVRIFFFLKRNTQSRAQDELAQHKGNGKQAPDVPDDSRTIHPVLSNNKRTIHTVPTENSHMWTQLERIGIH